MRQYPIVWITVAIGGIAAALLLAGLGGYAQGLATVYVAIIIVITGADMLKDIARGHWGLDILAVVAMVATLSVGEYIASLIIVLMISGGEALEDYAARRANRELDALLARAPQWAHRILTDPDSGAEQTEDIAADDVKVGDVLLVRAAEVLPVDGVLLGVATDLDESSLTGESLPVQRGPGEAVMSGALAGSDAFRMRATATSADSQYQRIINLVREAEKEKAPVVRIADKFAVPFTVLSLIIGGLAWALSGDATRFAEVMVLATPCPLLIAAPVAFMGGMSRASRAGIIVKGGAALEQLARIRSAAFDKTGTLTAGRPDLIEVHTTGGRTAEQLLFYVASAELFSSHVVAESIVRGAKERGVEPTLGAHGSQVATDGVRAQVEGVDVVVGKRAFVQEHNGPVIEEKLAAGFMAVYVSLDGEYAGHLVLGDHIRDDAAATLAELREMGIDPIFMLTGDARSVADGVAEIVGIDEVHAGLLPEDKVRLVAHAQPGPTMMIGDGVNDAPVLATAAVGIAMGARGSTAAGESADVIIVSEGLNKVSEAVQIGRDTLHIAFSAIWVGVLLSVGLMLVAAFGYIPAVAGALTQEFVDLAAILYALRALRGRKPRTSSPRTTSGAATRPRKMQEQH